MARERSPNRDKAKEMYLSAKGEIKLTEIATEEKEKRAYCKRG